MKSDQDSVSGDTVVAASTAPSDTEEEEMREYLNRTQAETQAYVNCTQDDDVDVKDYQVKLSFPSSISLEPGLPDIVKNLRKPPIYYSLLGERGKSAYDIFGTLCVVPHKRFRGTVFDWWRHSCGLYKIKGSGCSKP